MVALKHRHRRRLHQRNLDERTGENRLASLVFRKTQTGISHVIKGNVGVLRLGESPESPEKVCGQGEDGNLVEHLLLRVISATV